MIKLTKVGHNILTTVMQKVLSGDIDDADKRYGICHLLRKVAYPHLRNKPRKSLVFIGVDQFFKATLCSWEYYSNCTVFPIPTSKDNRCDRAAMTFYMHAGHMYNTCGQYLLWEGEQLELRKHLANHVLNQLEKVDVSELED